MRKFRYNIPFCSVKEGLYVIESDEELDKEELQDKLIYEEYREIISTEKKEYDLTDMEVEVLE